VILVEDEDAVRRITRIAMEAQGYTVLEANSGAEAIQVASQHAGPIHLVVTDVVMPGMSGPELVEALRSLRPNLKVLYVSGYTDDSVVRYGLTTPTDAFLQKPFTPLALGKKVRDILEGAG
jgi:CheY-like chemotaxis protein